MIKDIKLKPHQCYMGKEDLKAADVKLPWSNEMLIELGKCETDPIYFIENYVKLSVADGGDLIPFVPFAFQRELLNIYHTNRYVITMAPRQHSKCFSQNTTVKIRNKITGEIRQLSIGDFYKMQKDSRVDK